MSFKGKLSNKESIKFIFYFLKHALKFRNLVKIKPFVLKRIKFIFIMKTCKTTSTVSISYTKDNLSTYLQKLLFILLKALIYKKNGKTHYLMVKNMTYYFNETYLINFIFYI